MRDFLNKALPLHTDFDAFCIDRFCDLARRMGTGWDLLSKQNLLLTTIPAEQLLAALEAAFASDGAVLRQLSELRRHLSPDELQRQRHSAELEQLCEARALRLATGGATQDLDPRIRELKQLLRRFPQLQEGEILGERYKLLSLLGKGGFARVYQAYDLLHKSLVAVKVLHSESSDDQRTLSRFERGARQMAQLSHPHIVRVLGEPAEQDGFHYFVMEYLSGGDLARAVSAGVLSSLDKLRVVLEVGSALRAAHQRQLIHRDVKPENILLDGQLHAKLTDFDLVWAADTTGGTRSRAGIGTYLYAAPEQLIDASQVSYSADIYGLAMLTIFILRGNLPTWFRDYRTGTIDGLQIHQAFRSLLDRATQPSPAYRPSLGEFLRTAGTHWPFDDEDQITAKVQLLDQHELGTVAPKAERAEAVHSAATATTLVEPADLPITTREQRPAIARPTVAAPESASTLDPVTTDHGGAPKRRSRRLLELARWATIPIFGVFWGTAQLRAPDRWVTTAIAGVNWGIARLREPVPIDPNVAAAKLLLEIDDDMDQGRWSDAFRKTATLTDNSTLSRQFREAAVSKQLISMQEEGHQKAYDRMYRAAASERYGEVLIAFRTIAISSVYHYRAKSIYDQIFPLFVDSHLKAARSARAAGRCAEAKAEVEKVLDVDPNQLSALAAKAQRCVELPIMSVVPRAVKARPIHQSSPAATSSSSKAQPAAPPPEVDVKQVKHVEHVLTNAQSEFVNGNYDKAISLARSVGKHDANRAWRIIGAAACRNKDLPLVTKAYNHLDPAARQYLIYVCQREGIVQNGNQFKMAE